nr:MAG TPA: hypothetical protein [Caudoviricetes sp.]
MFKEQTITGESLANSLNSIILFKKISTIEEKMREYKKDLDKLVVDIPEFCKPKEEQFEHIINRQINEMIRNNTLDYYYHLALD